MPSDVPIAALAGGGVSFGRGVGVVNDVAFGCGPPWWTMTGAGVAAMHVQAAIATINLSSAPRSGYRI
jgi:hypothetical protein